MSVPAGEASLPSHSHMWTQHSKFKMKIFHVLPKKFPLHGHTTGFCPVSKVRTTLYSIKMVPQEITSK